MADRTVQIRPATPSDLDAVGRVHALSRQAAYVDLMPADALARVTPERQAEVWRTRLAATPDPHAVHVAVVDGVVQGFVVGETEGGTAQLVAIHTLPEQHGSGAGQRLHDRLLADFADWGCDTAELWVLEGNERAQSFYRRNGWTRDGTRKPHAVGGIVVPTLRYVRQLLE
ncbi:MAG: N-acetyltransferase [Nocardioidaceae bacterium]